MEQFPAETRETIEESPKPLLIDELLDQYNAGEITLEQAAATFQQYLKEAI